MIKELGMKEIELEKQIIKDFEAAGWTVKIPAPFTIDGCKQIRPDIEIFDDDKSFGYVEIKKCLNPRMMLQKVEQWKDIVSKLKPLLFIITDGVEYHVSIRGKEFEVLHFVPRPKTGYPIMALIEDYMAFLNKKDDK